MEDSSKDSFEGYSTVISEGKSISHFYVLANTQPPSTSPSKDEDKDSKSKEYVTQGPNDDQLIKNLKKAESDSVLLPGIRFNTSMYFGGGVAYGKLEVDPQSKQEVITPFIDTDIKNFIERSKIQEQMYTALLDCEASGYAVFQFQFSKDFKKIALVTTEFTRAPWIRFGKRNSLGNFDKVYLNANFGTNEFKKDDTKTIKCLPIFWDNDDVISFAKDQVKSFAAIVRVPDLRRQYYPRPDWNSVIDSGWFEVGQAIAKSKLYLLNNQFSVKYHIEIHRDYWSVRFGSENWKRFKADEQQVKKKEELDKITAYLQGVDKIGSTFFSEMFESIGGTGNSELRSMIKITELKFNATDGGFMKESNESSDHKLSALMIHPEIIGSAPGSKMGAGSGSASRVAFNQRVSLSLFKQLNVLDVMRVVRDYNGWPNDTVFYFRNSLITTLDTGGEVLNPDPIPPAK